MEKLYTKEINNEIKVLPKYKIVIVKDNSQTFDPSEEMLFEDGWSVYEEPTIIEESEEYEETLDDLKRHKILEVKQYDRSDNINEFYINGTSMWFNKTERLNLMSRLNVEEVFDKTETTWWYNGNPLVLNVSEAKTILYAVEKYAEECYDNTQRHILEIKKLTDKDSIDSYDFQTGYPTKLEFKL